VAPVSAVSGALASRSAVNGITPITHPLERSVKKFVVRPLSEIS
jgi:hypothetical protein